MFKVITFLVYLSAILAALLGLIERHIGKLGKLLDLDSSGEAFKRSVAMVNHKYNDHF